MVLVYSDEKLPGGFSKSIFLAGPSPRDPAVGSWRVQAVAELALAGYDGAVLIPEPRGGFADGVDYDTQIGWETEALAMADAIVFWIPRDLEVLPGFTTNVEFGRWAGSGKAVLGAPAGAPKNRYLFEMAKRLGVATYDNLGDALAAGLAIVGAGGARVGGERYVPSTLWNKPSFQSWYRAQGGCGNRLMRAEVLGELSDHPESIWSLRPSVAVAGEGRIKCNEQIVGRGDLVCVAAWGHETTLGATRVLCVSEFRSAVTNTTGKVLELPGGGASGDESLVDVAVKELAEETGLVVDPGRLSLVGSRQVAATILTHRAHLFALELTSHEMIALGEAQRQGRVFGEEGSSERTTVQLCQLDQLAFGGVMDWAMMGMVYQAVATGHRPIGH
jgi:8-oxo-dGTP pyrophosphatase MutT (NUDIX family)